jgi:hypothetical protein
MFTKQHYIAIAKMVSDVKTEHGDNITLQQLEYKLREYFSEDNPNFDRVRFSEACKSRM